MTNFERLLVADKSTHEEPKNPYYKHNDSVEVIEAILDEFALNKDTGHIINGHIPVKFKDGESPIKGGGRLICIDGGFCKAYQSTTGIAGYTLISNSYGLRLASHEPFTSIENAVLNNTDIHSHTNIVETGDRRYRVSDTDIGHQINQQIEALNLLLEAYRDGSMQQDTRR
jgi:fructose-1,6-bisphosphatase-3